MDPKSPNSTTSSTGLPPNLAGTLAYLLGPVTGIVFLVVEKESRFVRFHAMQSTITFGGLFVLQVVLNLVPFIGWVVGGLIIFPLSVLLWVFLMFKAFSGEMFKLPTIGDMAERQL